MRIHDLTQCNNCSAITTDNKRFSRMFNDCLLIGDKIDVEVVSSSVLSYGKHELQQTRSARDLFGDEKYARRSNVVLQLRSTVLRIFVERATSSCNVPVTLIRYSSLPICGNRSTICSMPLKRYYDKRISVSILLPFSLKPCSPQQSFSQQPCTHIFLNSTDDLIRVHF